jgi:Aspartyl protease
MKFTKPWAFLQPPEEGGVATPVLSVLMRQATGRLQREQFIVDSGADISMAPQSLCEELGLDWRAGSPIAVRGISPKDECVVAGRIHEVSIHVIEADLEVVVPICFAEGEAPQLLGRERFFDAFLIEFDKRRQLTAFEW